MKYFINFLLIFFPLQYFALEIGTTKFDIFNILFLIFFPIVSFYLGLNKNRLVLFGCYVFFSLILFFNSDIQYPNYRFYSSFIWLTLTFFTFINSYDFYYSKLFSLINSIGLVLLFGILCDKLIYPNDRPKLFFSEPSVAGLVMYAYSFVFFYLTFIGKDVKLNFFKGGGFFIAGLLTESAHLITFFVLIVFVLISKFKIKHFFIPVVLGFFAFAFIPESLLNKISLDENIDGYSLSQLSWLQGYNQAISSVKLNPFIGQGFGSTGYISFFSDYERVLEKSDLVDLNRYDGYSLFFRWVIELGFVVTIVIILYFLFNLITGLRQHNVSESDRFIIFLFGFFIFFGSLVKEPNYGFSTFLLSFYLMGMYLPALRVVKKIRRSSQSNALEYQKPFIASP